MKKIVYLLSVLICAFSLSAQDNLPNEIDVFLDSWHRAAEINDQHEYFNKIDDNGIYIGTDSTEIWSKQEFYDWATPYFLENKTWHFVTNSRNIYFSEKKDIVWFDELINYGNGTLRGSGVLVKRDHEWKIIHYVLSVPVPNDKFKMVMEKINSNPIPGKDKK